MKVDDAMPIRNSLNIVRSGSALRSSSGRNSGAVAAANCCVDCAETELTLGCGSDAWAGGGALSSINASSRNEPSGLNRRRSVTLKLLWFSSAIVKSCSSKMTVKSRRQSEILAFQVEDCQMKNRKQKGQKGQKYAFCPFCPFCPFRFPSQI